MSSRSKEQAAVASLRRRGMTFEAIAERMGKSREWVTTRWYEYRRRYRNTPKLFYEFERFTDDVR